MRPGGCFSALCVLAFGKIFARPALPSHLFLDLFPLCFFPVPYLLCPCQCNLCKCNCKPCGQSLRCRLHFFFVFFKILVASFLLESFRVAHPWSLTPGAQGQRHGDLLQCAFLPLSIRVVCCPHAGQLDLTVDSAQCTPSCARSSAAIAPSATSRRRCAIVAFAGGVGRLVLGA